MLAFYFQPKPLFTLENARFDEKFLVCKPIDVFNAEY